VEGIQIVLPPGGANGATPEIHRLAAYSGLVYADAGQLYRDPAGYVRLRTVSGKDPVVSAVYSRVNSDSALFDLERQICLRDAESGKPVYLMDPLKSLGTRHGKPFRNSDGKFVPLESHYVIPGALEAIHGHKLYLGGLNRILDNKTILATLCYYAPRFFKKELQTLGLDPETILPISPPETLPSTSESVRLIEQNPEEWVVKAPNLSGGKGIHILKSMSVAGRKTVLNKARMSPKKFAYQKLVRIARLPIALMDRKEGYRYSNRAADLRMWAFLERVRV